MTPDRYTVAVDFDGVLHSYTSRWVAADVIPDPPVAGAIEWLHAISQHFTVIIHTTRGATHEGREAVWSWLVEHGYRGARPEVTNVKPPALAYLDDRAIRFGGPGTFPSVQEIHDARPWNRPSTR